MSLSDTADTPKITVSKEIIWHMTCGSCSYYWTVPTMSEADNPARRSWTCPLCATKSDAVEQDF